MKAVLHELPDPIQVETTYLHSAPLVIHQERVKGAKTLEKLNLSGYLLKRHKVNQFQLEIELQGCPDIHLLRLGSK